MSGIKGQISGGGKLMAKLGELQNVAYPVAASELAHAVFSVHREAVKLIQARSSQGRSYSRGTITHVASAPGNPPNTDRGTLVNRVDFEIDTQALKGVVGTNYKVGKHLELGTQTMAARPWLFPAFESRRKDILASMSKALKSTLKGVGRAR